jgi:dTDP-4-amino-4,6-dideoxygalactose transaminase
MLHLILDGPSLLALEAGKSGQPGGGTPSRLLELSRSGRVRLWAHPHVVTNSVTGEDGVFSAQSARELLDDVRLLPATAVQLREVLAQAPRNLLQRLTARCAADYLGEFVIVAEDPSFDAPGTTIVPLASALKLAEEDREEAVQFIDLKRQQLEISAELEQGMFQVVKSCGFILGPEVQQLERELGEYTHTEHVVSCSTGTEALLLALMAYGIGPGDAVLTTPFTFIATAEVISLLGATPVFVDIDPRTYNIDPVKIETALEALKRKDPAMHPLPSGYADLKPRAIITVDLFGLPADYDRINAFAARNGLAVIEDAAQSFGGVYHGRKACGLADVGCTSFYPAKPLGCYGEGGACFTNDKALAEAMRSIRVHGSGISRYEHSRLGTNARLASLQAATLLPKLRIFPAELDLRESVARRYSELMGASGRLTLPFIPEGYRSAWAQFSLLAPDAAARDEYREGLSANAVPTAIHYPMPLHRQEVFIPLGYEPGDFPVAENTSQRIFSLPMHPYIDGRSLERIASLLNSF